jgi:penicillin-binding protein-related factor A (putative recombinase)
VASNIVASGGTLSVYLGLWSYIRFFRSIEKSKNKVLFLDFKEIIDNPVAALSEISDISKITFNLDEFSKQEETELFNTLKRHNKEQKQNSELAAVPDKGRKRRSEAIKEELKKSSLYLPALREYEAALELCKNTKETVVVT